MEILLPSRAPLDNKYMKKGNSFFGGSSQPKNLTHVSYVSCTGRQVLYHLSHLGSPVSTIDIFYLEGRGCINLMDIKWFF